MNSHFDKSNALGLPREIFWKTIPAIFQLHIPIVPCDGTETHNALSIPPKNMDRSIWRIAGIAAALATFIPSARAAVSDGETDILGRHALATRHFGNDSPWYEANIPFFECSDPEITEVYYYRWQLWKAHIRDLGDSGTIITEFLDDVGWSIRPYQSLNDATAFHIHEGRWIRDRNYVNGYIDFMYNKGGNDRHFSEAIADAVYADYLATGDKTFATSYLASMEKIFQLWSDHYDTAKNLYFIQPILDATEFSIASIDATGGKWGFGGGEAFRPTINSFMFADAMAISKLSALAGDADKAKAYAATAASIKDHVQNDLWNPDMEHFIDRYKANNQFVHYWDFIRGRELAGYTPWYFELPDNDPKFNVSWQRLLAPDGFAGPYGLRTVEPSYQYYMRQYIYEPKTNPRKPECQWNGPSWPFDETLVLGGIANLLNDYSQGIVHTEDYDRLLRQYAHQHYLGDQLDLQEDYNPDTGAVIVGLPRSHHYNHSDFCDLVISGLAGLRPRPDNILEVNPLVPATSGIGSINYLCLENVPYHGHLVTILYDRDGRHYGKGAGLSVYVDGERVIDPSALGRKTVEIKPLPPVEVGAGPVDLAVNFRRKGFPAPSASTNNTPGDLYQAVDGRVWYFANVRNCWSTLGSPNAQDWFSVDFGSDKQVSTAKLYFYSDEAQFKAPHDYTVQAWIGAAWTDVPGALKTPTAPLGNGENTITFPPVTTSKLRVVFTNADKAATALVELKAY